MSKLWNFPLNASILKTYNKDMIPPAKRRTYATRSFNKQTETPPIVNLISLDEAARLHQSVWVLQRQASRQRK